MSAPVPDVTAYLGDVARRISRLAGHGLEGVWALGSVARGGYEPGISDVDVAACVGAPLAKRERRDLHRALSHRALPCPARKLELVVYTRAVLADPASALAFELNLNTGAGGPDHVTFDIADESPHWFLLDLEMGREASVPLVGSPLAELLGPIPRASILDALRTSIAWFDRNESDRASVVLAACRAWLYAQESAWGTKAEAAEWVASRHDELRMTVRRALALRRGEAVPPLATGDVDAVLERTRRALR